VRRVREGLVVGLGVGGGEWWYCEWEGEGSIGRLWEEGSWSASDGIATHRLPAHWPYNIQGLDGRLPGLKSSAACFGMLGCSICHPPASRYQDLVFSCGTTRKFTRPIWKITTKRHIIATLRRKPSQMRRSGDGKQRMLLASQRIGGWV